MTTTQPRQRDVLKGMGHVREEERDDWWRSWLVRTTALLIGTLALGIAFIWAYAGVLHQAPIGVFRQVDRPAYDDLVRQQVDTAKETQGPGDLQSLITGSDTWTVA